MKRHWVMPLRDFMEGRSSVADLLVMGIGDHLFHNVIVANLFVCDI